MRPGLIQYLLISPVQLLLVCLILIPCLFVGWLSLNNLTFGTEAEFVGLDNYANLLTDPDFWRAFWNTLILVNVIVYLELALGLGIALFFAGGIPFPKLMICIVLIPYAVSEVVAIIMFKYLFDYQVGIVNIMLGGIGIPPLEWGTNYIHSFILITIIAVWQHLPFTFILLYTARIGIPNEIYEAARLDGGSSFAICRRITIPLMMPAILISVLFRCIFAFRIFSEVWLLTEGGPARRTEVLAVYLYRLGFRYHEFGAASAAGWAMLVLSLAISAFYLRAMYRRMFA
ncbi:carbohydrate ABC transporter permease [Pseudochelatococcus sp. B33]